MPALRPAWRGQLRLSLVTIMVELYPAQTEARTKFRQIHQPTMKPVNYDKVVKGLGAVPPEEIVRAFEYEKGDFVYVTDEEIDSVRLDTKKTLDLVQFVDLDEISPVYFDKAYYVAPADELAEDAYMVIRDSLANSGKVGVGQLAMRGKEYLAALQGGKDGLILNTLHYQDEVKRAEEAFRGIDAAPADADIVALARQLIQRNTRPFDASQFQDNYEVRLKALVDQKVKALPKKAKAAAVASDEQASGFNVIDLMASLKRSLENAPGGPAAAPKSSARGTKGSAPVPIKSARTPARKKAG